MSHGACPLEFRYRVFGRQSQPRAEWGRVLFGDAIRENNFCRNTILRQHLVTLFVIPSARQLLLDGRTPLIIDFLDEELLLGLVHHLDLDIHRHVDEIVVLAVDVGLVLRDGQPSVAVGRNNG